MPTEGIPADGHVFEITYVETGKEAGPSPAPWRSNELVKRVLVPWHDARRAVQAFEDHLRRVYRGRRERLEAENPGVDLGNQGTFESIEVHAVVHVTGVHLVMWQEPAPLEALGVR